MNSKILAAIAVLLVIIGAFFLFKQSDMTDPRSEDGVSSGPVQASPADRAAIEAFVVEFGTKLQSVSLLAPEPQLSASLGAYAPYVSSELLAEWKASPSNGLGRETSSPYPHRIQVTSVTVNNAGDYTVDANIIDVTNDQFQDPAAVHPVTLIVEKAATAKGWTITSVAKGESSEMPARISVTGNRICLPHKNTSGPQTLECAIGIKSDDGKNYALSTVLLSSTDAAMTINTAERMRVEGVVTKAEALSTDMWQKYDIVGILAVTAVTKLDK
ncbi:MAG TPA: hypothetical protein VGE35_01110 [Candidatus Paceibacterota bacterium]